MVRVDIVQPDRSIADANLAGAGFAGSKDAVLNESAVKSLFGKVAVAGVRTRVIGRISMDMTTVDLSALQGRQVRVGDTVEFFGDVIPVEEVAEQLATIPYEVFTRIGPRVVRAYGQARDA